jgi:hypothetical protein
VREAESTEATINAAREGYRGPPARGATLWFVVSDLPGLGPMYQTSLRAFKAMFVHCIAAATTPGASAPGAAARLAARLAGLTDYLTSYIYNTVSFVDCMGRCHSWKGVNSSLVVLIATADDFLAVILQCRLPNNSKESWWPSPNLVAPPLILSTAAVTGVPWAV